jgi:hypothetical protein
MTTETDKIRDEFTQKSPHYTIGAMADEILRLRGDKDTLLIASCAVVDDALDRVEVHPCDEHDNDVKSRRLGEEMYSLYQATRLIK